MTMTDDLLDLVHDATGDKRLALKYNKGYIGLARDGVPDNLISMRPRKEPGVVLADLKDAEE